MQGLEHLYEVVCARKSSPQEGSYTCYLFDQGLDKILKKIGEEATETVIAAKNGETDALCEEMADLLYHLTVLLAHEGIALDQVNAVLEARSQKIGNLKTFHQVDRNS